MSSTLFKKSLEIVDDEFKSKRKSLIPEAKKKTTAFDLIPENHRLVKTVKQYGRKKRAHASFFPNRTKLLLETKINEISATKKLTVDDIKKQISTQGDQAEENLNKLLKLSSCNKIEVATIQKIVRRAKAGHYIVPEVPKPVVEQSVFTEEDFANLEKELYFDD